MLRLAGSVVLGILVTCAFTFALITLGGGLLFNPNRASAWLLVTAVLGACTIPFFLGSMVTAYVGQRSGWKLGLVIYLFSAAFFFIAFLPISFGETLLDTILTFVMAFSLAFLFSLYGGMLGQRILVHRRRTRTTVMPFNVEGEAIDASTQEQ